MKDYPSVPYFQRHGLRVWPSSWRSRTAAKVLFDCARSDATPKMIGHLCTTWCGTTAFCRALLREDVESLSPNAIKAAETFRTIADMWER